MSPTKYCNAIRCTDCKSYKECLQNKYDTISAESDYMIQCPSGMMVTKEDCDMCSQCRPRH